MLAQIPSKRKPYKPYILCFKCRGNLLDCKCAAEESSARWMSERRNYYNSPNRPEVRVTKEISPNRVETKMRFVFKGETYAIDFKRDYRQIRVGVDENDNDVFESSRFPSTTCNLLKLDPTSVNEKGQLTLKNSEVVATATVGCWHREPTFSKETGRLRALHNMMRTISREMKPFVWAAYQNRGVRASENLIPPITPAAAAATIGVESQLVS